MDKLSISYKSGSRHYSMLCERIKKTDAIEEYKLSAQGNPAKFIILQNDRPLIREKYGLKSKKINWKVIQGNIRNQKILNDIIAMIESAIDKQ